MASDLQNIQTIKSNLLTKLAAISADPKPTYNVDGQQVNWQEYFDSLMSQVDKCNALLGAEDPFEIITRGDLPAGDLPGGYCR